MKCQFRQCYPRFRSSFGLRKLAQKIAQRIGCPWVTLGCFHQTCLQSQISAGLFVLCFLSKFFGVGHEARLIALLEPAERCIKHCQRRQVGIGITDLLKADGRVFEMFRAILDLGREQVYALENGRVGT